MVKYDHFLCKQLVEYRFRLSLTRSDNLVQVKLAEANRAKTVSLEELDDLKAKLREQREYRKKVRFLRHTS